MTYASPFEKRASLRLPSEERGIFHPDGEEPVVVKLRDTSPRGVGLYSRKAFPVGARAVLNVKLGEDAAAKSYPTEICWCAPSTERDSFLHPFRLGLRMLTTAEKTPEKTPAPRPAGAPAPEPLAKETSFRVKGSMLIDFAKMIRRYHDKPWQKYLTLDDMKVINDMIIPAKWYSLEILQHAATAVYEIFGQHKPESVKQWGRDLVERVPADLYASFFNKKDPLRAGINFINVNMRVFDFLRFKCDDAGTRQLRVIATGEPEVRRKVPQLPLIALLLAGALEHLAKKNGAATANTVIDHHPQGDSLFTLTLSWS